MICLYCRREMFIGTRPKRSGQHHGLYPTVDHIVPRHVRKLSFLETGITNIRTVCKTCNSLRSACGDCVGALAAIWTVVDDIHKSPWTVFRMWKQDFATAKRVGG
jgi:hypothetical protein